MHAGKGLMSFQERCPLLTARTMHLSHNIITVHIWGTYGKRTIKNRLNELYGVSSTPLSARFLRSSSGPAGEKLQGRKLKHLESSRGIGRQRLPEGSRTTHIYNTIQMTFTYRKCSRSCEIWHYPATGNKKQTWKQPTHPKRKKSKKSVTCLPENCSCSCNMRWSSPFNLVLSTEYIVAQYK